MFTVINYKTQSLYVDVHIVKKWIKATDFLERLNETKKNI